MKIDKYLSDESIIAEIGKRIAQQRIDSSQTQAEAAETAGISKRTVEHIENGDSVQLISFIRMLRAVGSVDALQQLLPEVEVRPLDMIKRKGKIRKRVSRKQYTLGNEDPMKAAEPWKWGDEK